MPITNVPYPVGHLKFAADSTHLNDLGMLRYRCQLFAAIFRDQGRV
jgi:hypothetical protein